MLPTVSFILCVCVSADEVLRSSANVAYRAAREAVFDRLYLGLQGLLCFGQTLSMETQTLPLCIVLLSC